MTSRELKNQFKGARILSGILAVHFIGITQVAIANDYPNEKVPPPSKKAHRRLTSAIHGSMKRYSCDFLYCALELLTRNEWAQQLPVFRRAEFAPIAFHDDMHNLILDDLFCDVVQGRNSKSLIDEIEHDAEIGSESIAYIDSIVDYIVDQFIGGEKIEQQSNAGLKYEVV